MQRIIQLGGEGSILQIAHANAYVPECYGTLAQHLSDNYKVLAQRSRALWPGHHPREMTNWNILAKDLIETMSDHKLEKVIGIGHSSGAIATWMAARMRPDLFSKLILIEPVILPKTFVRLVAALPYSFSKHLIPMVKVALRRTNRWASKDEIADYLRSKRVFSRFHPDVLKDFINHGFTQTKEGSYTLAFPRDWEARIYGHVPNVWPMAGEMPCPSLIIKAQYSDVITEKTWESLQKVLTHATLHEQKDSGHLLPFEKPEITAKLIKDFLSQE